ncbi:MAG: NAD(P)/FAD-dependent oxidoreductase [Myxococcota bacterium]
MKPWDLVVVGAGPAGVAAAAEAARQGVRPLLLDVRGVAGGTISIAHEVRNIPFFDGPVGGARVAEHLDRYLKQWDVAVQRARVTGLRLTRDGVVVSAGDGRVLASRLVLALGTEPVFPPVEGLEPDGRRFVGSASEAWEQTRPHRVAVIGGSDVAMDQSRWLRARGCEVELLVRGTVRAPLWLTNAARAEGVRIRCGTRAVGASVRDEVCLSVARDGSVSELRVDAVIAAVGRKPATLAGLSEIAGASHIRVVGDGTGRRARHVVAALGDGCIAATELLAQGEGGEDEHVEKR